MVRTCRAWPRDSHRATGCIFLVVLSHDERAVQQSWLVKRKRGLNFVYTEALAASQPSRSTNAIIADPNPINAFAPPLTPDKNGDAKYVSSDS